jgi:hypothetical protein
VKELRGTESTKKSIQKLKKSSSTRDAKGTPDIILAISYRGVKFLNAVTKVCKICPSVTFHQLVFRLVPILW